MHSPRISRPVNSWIDPRPSRITDWDQGAACMNALTDGAGPVSRRVIAESLKIEFEEENQTRKEGRVCSVVTDSKVAEVTASGGGCPNLRPRRQSGEENGRIGEDFIREQAPRPHAEKEGGKVAVADSQDFRRSPFTFSRRGTRRRDPIHERSERIRPRRRLPPTFRVLQKTDSWNAAWGYVV